MEEILSLHKLLLKHLLFIFFSFFGVKIIFNSYFLNLELSIIILLGVIH